MNQPKINKELLKKLSPEQINVCFYKGTEPPFTGKYTDNKEKGVYHCVVCDNPLFSSEAKFDAGSGWPSFHNIIKSESVKLQEDLSHGMYRIEILCSGCEAHLGHMFHKGYTDKSSVYYCVNSAALNFKKSEK